MVKILCLFEVKFLEFAVRIRRKLKVILALQIKVPFMSSAYKFVEELKTYLGSNQSFFFALFSFNFDVSIDLILSQQVVDDLREKTRN